MVEPHSKHGHGNERFGQRVGRKAERKLRARRETARPTWYWLGMFGIVGWSIAIPTVLGAMLGAWIDRRWPGSVSWTLNLLIIGLLIGCVHAWLWVRQESRNNRRGPPP